jgi:hypothetical protein
MKMNINALTNRIKIALIVAIFLGGLYFYLVYSQNKIVEGLTDVSGELRCPNLLIQKGPKYYLYNSNLVQVPGVNPVMFNNLDEYNEFLRWQKGAGIRCPVLYVQNSYDAQGNRVYKVRPSVNELEGGLSPTLPSPIEFTKLVDATQADKPYNINSYPAYDPTSYYVGTYTPLDAMKHAEANMLYSANAMDPNWGGEEYTKMLIDSGYYDGSKA